MPTDFAEVLDGLGMDFWAYPELLRNARGCLEALALVYPLELRAFVKRYEEGLTVPEIAAAEGRADRTIQRWLYGFTRERGNKTDYRYGAFHWVAAMFQLVIESRDVDVYGPDTLLSCFTPEVSGEKCPLEKAYHRQLFSLFLDTLMGELHGQYLYISMPWEENHDAHPHPHGITSRGIGWPCYRTPARHNAFPGLFKTMTECCGAQELVCLCLGFLVLSSWTHWPRLLAILNAGNSQIITRRGGIPVSQKGLMQGLKEDAKELLEAKDVNSAQFLLCLAFLAKTPLEWPDLASLRKEGRAIMQVPSEDRVRQCVLHAFA
ncbi:MAG: helix-turn-helix domain-containing protein [Proteobacteria bacterium]|nr:helix-turn-helix domain-containing protein [Pseudomonadota bacterium]